MTNDRKKLPVQPIRRLVVAPTLAIVTLSLLTTLAFANEQRFTNKSPGGATPVDNWAFGLSLSAVTLLAAASVADH